MPEPIDHSKIPAFGEGGWFWLSPEGDKLREDLAQEAEDKADELARAYRLTFQSPHGQRVLRDLIHRTLDQPTWVPGVTDPVHAGMAREGQNSLTRYIIAIIGTQVQTAPPTPQPPKETANAEPEPIVARASSDYVPTADSPRRRVANPAKRRRAKS